MEQEWNYLSSGGTDAALIRRWADEGEKRTNAGTLLASSLFIFLQPLSLLFFITASILSS